MKHGYTALTATLLIAGMAGTAHSDCSGAGYTIPASNPGTVLSGKRIVTDDGQSKEDHCSNGNLFKVGNPAKPVIDPRAFRGTWSPSAAPSGSAGQVTYSYTVGGSNTYTFSLYQNVSGALCWQDSGGNVVATASSPTSFSDSCNP